jgi:diguanylate cyclase (GGDEF)-like protein
MQHSARHPESHPPPEPGRAIWRPYLERLGAVGASMLLVLGCWQLAGAISERMVRGELQTQIEARQQLAYAVTSSITQSLDGDLAMLHGIPGALAVMPEVRAVVGSGLAGRLATLAPANTQTRRALLERDVPLNSLDHLFKQIGALSGLDIIWLVDPQGTCLASSNAGELNSFVGVSFLDRPFMGAVAHGEASIGVARGLSNGVPGIYVTSPIVTPNGVAGAIIGKMNLIRARPWVAQPGTFITDQNGVIILSHNRAYEWRALPGAPALSMDPALRDSIYLHKTIRPLTIMPQGPRLRAQAPWLSHVIADGLVSVEHGPPALLRLGTIRQHGLSTGLTIPFDPWDEAEQNYRRNRMLIFFATLSTMVVCIVLSLSYFRERRLHRATRDLAAQLQEANGRLSDEARYDALTGALSRRYFLDLLRTELRAAQLTHQPLSMMIADLDHFKQINDRYGHATGDRALEYFIRVCERVLGVDDAIGRLGGEEFGMLMPGAAAAQAEQIAERIRLDFRRGRPQSIPDDIGLSVSIGIAVAQREDSPERLLSRADQALYLAKARGRNRCMVFDTHTEPVREGEAVTPD